MHWNQFHNKIIQTILGKIVHISNKCIRKVKRRIYNLRMHIHTRPLYLLEEHNNYQD